MILALSVLAGGHSSPTIRGKRRNTRVQGLEGTAPDIYTNPGAFRSRTQVIWRDGHIESIGRVKEHTTVQTKAISFFLTFPRGSTLH